MLGEGPRDERALFSERLKAALAYRDALAPDGTAYRLVSAEADVVAAKYTQPWWEECSAEEDSGYRDV